MHEGVPTFPQDATIPPTWGVTGVNRRLASLARRDRTSLWGSFGSPRWTHHLRGGSVLTDSIGFACRLISVLPQERLWAGKGAKDATPDAEGATR